MNNHMTPTLQKILDKATAGERLTFADANNGIIYQESLVALSFICKA